MNTRLVWFIAGGASTGAVSSVIWLLFSPNHVVESGEVSDDFNNAFAIHGPLKSDWARVHQLGELDVWSDTTNTTLAITENGRAVQLLTSEDGCCTFDIFEYGEYKATIRYGNYDQRLISQGRDQNGIVWTYVDMGINGTIDFRFKEGVSDSTQQVIMTEFAGDVSSSNEFAERVSDSSW